MKKKTILCAVDFSESSQEALNWTFELAKRTQAKVVVMFCYRLIALMDDDETLSLKKRIEEEAIMKFKEYERIQLNGHSVAYKFTTEVGFFHFRIEMFLKKNPVGLLVIGSSVVQNFDEYRNVGFDKFLENLKVPVLIVPHEFQVANTTFEKGTTDLSK